MFFFPFGTCYSFFFEKQINLDIEFCFFVKHPNMHSILFKDRIIKAYKMKNDKTRMQTVPSDMTCYRILFFFFLSFVFLLGEEDLRHQYKFCSFGESISIQINDRFCFLVESISIKINDRYVMPRRWETKFCPLVQ